MYEHQCKTNLCLSFNEKFRIKCNRNCPLKALNKSSSQCGTQFIDLPKQGKNSASDSFQNKTKVISLSLVSYSNLSCFSNSEYH